jgi:hypothetical protein
MVEITLRIIERINRDTLLAVIGLAPIITLGLFMAFTELHAYIPYQIQMMAYPFVLVLGAFSVIYLAVKE